MHPKTKKALKLTIVGLIILLSPTFPGIINLHYYGYLMTDQNIMLIAIMISLIGVVITSIGMRTLKIRLNKWMQNN